MLTVLNADDGPERPARIRPAAVEPGSPKPSTTDLANPGVSQFGLAVQRAVAGQATGCVVGAAPFNSAF
jgi:hypothetical protein